MRRAFLLTGFNNWGKTRLTYDIFNKKQFPMESTHAIPSLTGQFVVESHSNDDYGIKKYIETIEERIEKTKEINADLFCAFCPTREKVNNAIHILSTAVFQSFDEIHVLLLKYKWDLHAELRTDDIINYLTTITTTRFCIVNADICLSCPNERQQAKKQQILSYMNSVYSPA